MPPRSPAAPFPFGPGLHRPWPIGSPPEKDRDVQLQSHRSLGDFVSRLTWGSRRPPGCSCHNWRPCPRLDSGLPAVCAPRPTCFVGLLGSKDVGVGQFDRLQPLFHMARVQIGQHRGTSHVRQFLLSQRTDQLLQGGALQLGVGFRRHRVGKRLIELGFGIDHLRKAVGTEFLPGGRFPTGDAGPPVAGG